MQSTNNLSGLIEFKTYLGQAVEIAVWMRAHHERNWGFGEPDFNRRPHRRHGKARFASVCSVLLRSQSADHQHRRTSSCCRWSWMSVERPRCRENVFGGPVHDVKQAVLPGRNAENMRRTIEKCSLVQRLNEGEGKPVLGLPRQSDLDAVLVPDHYGSMDHLAAPGLRGDER